MFPSSTLSSGHQNYTLYTIYSRGSPKRLYGFFCCGGLITVGGLVAVTGSLVRLITGLTFKRDAASHWLAGLDCDPGGRVPGLFVTHCWVESRFGVGGYKAGVSRSSIGLLVGGAGS